MATHQEPASIPLRLVWHQRQDLERKLALGRAFGDGLPKDVDFRIVYDFGGVEPCDWLVLFGIGGIAKRIRDEYRAAGIPIIHIDKGYTRKSGHWRVSVGADQPLSYFQQRRSDDRWRALGIEAAPYRSGTHILVDGASNKFCEWKELGDWQDWGESVVRKIRQHTDRPIIYRPRPRHHHENRKPIGVDGAELSTGDLDWSRVGLCVSYGGAICVDAAINGVPHFAIGDSIARPISETDWSRLDAPRVPTEAERAQWFADLAYTQFTADEFRAGLAWQHIQSRLKGR